jgi:hypothetical protein
MRTSARGTRGYLAGFGTSGSLLAGAALLFVLGSAIVAFRGWPQIATGPATSAVAAPRVAAPSRVGRRLAAAIARRSPGRGGAATTHIRPLAAIGPGRVRAAHSAVNGGAAGTAPAASGSAGGGASVASCTAGRCAGTTSQSAINHLADAVTQGVSDAGSSVSSQIRGGSGTVAGAVGGVSPQTADAVQSTGDAAANVAAGGANTAANAVSQVAATAGGGR